MDVWVISAGSKWSGIWGLNTLTQMTSYLEPGFHAFLVGSWHVGFPTEEKSTLSVSLLLQQISFFSYRCKSIESFVLPMRTYGFQSSNLIINFSQHFNVFLKWKTLHWTKAAWFHSPYNYYFARTSQMLRVLSFWCIFIHEYSILLHC